MLSQSALPPSATGKLAENVLHFSRLLRTAGLPVGTDRALLALQALQLAGVPSRVERSCGKRPSSTAVMTTTGNSNPLAA